MTATQLQLRRGTSAQCAGMTPVDGEPIYDTTNDRLRLGDGSTAGGVSIPNYKDLLNDVFTRANSVGGTANAITLTYNPVTISDASGTRIKWKSAANITSASTVAVDGRSVVTLKKWEGGILVDTEDGDGPTGKDMEAVSNGTYYVLDQPDLGSGVISGQVPLAQVSGGGGSYDFTGYITSDYESYRLILQNILPATSGADLHLRVRRSGQGSYDSSGYVYRNTKSGGSPVTGTPGNFILLLSGISDSAGNGVGVSGEISGQGLSLSVRSQFQFLVGEYVTNANIIDAYGTGSLNTSAALDSVQLRFSSGNIASGKATLYGISGAS
jgi:hypothetical protein